LPKQNETKNKNNIPCIALDTKNRKDGGCAASCLDSPVLDEVCASHSLSMKVCWAVSNFLDLMVSNH
jgi:hypothetical protein